MNAKEILRQTIQRPFDEENFRQFIADFLNDYIQKQVSLVSFYNLFAEHINKFNLLGEYKDNQGKKIHILEVELKNSHKLENARTTQRNLVAKYLEDNWLDGALVAFAAPGYPRWRFSFVKLTWVFDKENKKTKKVLSPAKRYSFLIGEGEPSHTAQSQLLPILKQEQNPTLEQIEETFNIERVTKEFYQEYKKLFNKLCEELDKNRVFVRLKETKRIDTSNFAKKLLGQIVFLYFIQKKGWLGVPMDKKWGKGDRMFLRSLFERAKAENKNFFNDYLEPLFYNTLNKKPELPGTFYRKYFDSQIPFLNGGLFEPMKGYEWEDSLLLLDNNLFSNLEDTGILDVFDRYNFTVKEDEPLEKEVAIDPEMLGKIFENLLEENLRKGKGTYYTPREIVHYMCRESLINYLSSESKIDPADIRRYFTFMESGISIVDGHKENFGKLDALLKNIKVCDPACGSGAFLVGMLQDIVKLRLFFQNMLGKKEMLSEYQLKKETIQNCIYGVDIDPGAIEIAKLRLWLSLVVDYQLEEIEPLPNLDYKIMQGNSLLEELVLGDTSIKLFDLSLIGAQEKKMKNLFEEERQKDLFEQELKTNKIMKQLDELRRRYFKISDLSEKLELKKRIEDIEQDLVEQCVKKVIRELDSRINNISQYTALGVGLTKKYAKKLDKAISTQAGIRQMLQEFRESGIRPFFLWHLYFADIFLEKGGFDIVIANPPYIKKENLDSKTIDVLERYFTEEVGGRIKKWSDDLYVHFIFQGTKITRDNGVMSYITNDSFIGLASKLRVRRLLLKYNLLQLIRCPIKTFKATIYTAVFILQKSAPKIKEYESGYFSYPDFIYHRLGLVPYDVVFTLPNERLIFFNPILEIYKKLLDIPRVKNYLYILDTGIHSGNVREKIFFKDKIKDNLSPLLQGKQIERWGIFWDRPEAKYKYCDINYKPKLRKGIGRKGQPSKLNEYWHFCGNIKNHHQPERLLMRQSDDDLVVAYQNEKRTGRFYTDNTLFTILSKNRKISLKYAMALLNSNLLNTLYHFLSQEEGKTLAQVKTRLVSELPFAVNDQKPFINLVDKILAITKDDDYLENSAKQVKVREYERQINQLVYKLYGLTPEEIKIIESNSKLY